MKKRRTYEDVCADLEEAAELLHKVMEEFGVELDDVAAAIHPGDNKVLQSVAAFLDTYVPLGCPHQVSDIEQEKIGVCQLRYGHDGDHALVWVKVALDV